MSSKCRRRLFESLAALIICSLFVLLQQQFVGGLTVAVMTLRGKPRFCPLLNALDSYAVAEAQGRRTKQIIEGARLIESDSAGFDLFEAGSQRLWIPRGSLDEIALNMAEEERGVYDYRGLGPKPGDVVIDAGANVGLFTRQALKQAASMVIAVDPAPSSVECLRRNLKDEIAAGKVVICAKGLWDQDEMLDMHMDPANTTAGSFIINHKTRQSQRLSVTTLDRLVKELELKRVDFIKMDIEGAEQRALIGARDTIRTMRPRMAISVYHLADDPISIPDAIRRARADYRQVCGPCVWLGPVIYPHVYFFF